MALRLRRAGTKPVDEIAMHKAALRLIKAIPGFALARVRLLARLHRRRPSSAHCPMKRVLETFSRDLAARAAAALKLDGIGFQTIEEHEDDFDRWCLEVADPDFAAATEIVEREHELDEEEGSPFRCERCGIGMRFKVDEARDPSLSEFVCRKCGAIRAVWAG